MATNDTAELTAYKALRADIAARLAIVSPDPAAPSEELRALAERLVAVCDGQAGLAPPPPALRFEHGYVQDAGDFEHQVRRCALLSSSEWNNGSLPHRLLELTNAIAAS